MKKIMNRYKFFSRMQFVGILVLMITAFTASSCKDDNDDPSNADPLVGTWVATSVNKTGNPPISRPEEIKSVKLTLKLNSDHTGSIAEVGDYELKASVHKNTQVKFRWTTTPDDNTMTFNFVSGDWTIRVFGGDYYHIGDATDNSNVYWNRKYTLTGKTLILAKKYESWTFQKK